MFNYDVMCVVCGRSKVYEASFKQELSPDDIANKKSAGVCAKCAPNYKNLVEAGKKPSVANGPFFILKEGK